MISYQYTAREITKGSIVKSVIEATSESAAAKALSAQGLVALDIKVARESRGIPMLQKVKAKDKVLFSRQLSTLINAGLPLVQALHNVSNQTQNKNFRVVVSRVISDVEAGTTFSDALAKHPRVFNEIYLSLVQAGEVSGTLDQALERLAVQQEKDADTMRKIKGAFTYPIIVLLVMIGVMTFMMMTLLPQVEMMYSDTGQTLPPITAFLLAFVDIVVSYWWIVIVLIGLGGFFGFRWLHTGPGREVVDRLKMRFPAIGTLFMKMYMARFTRTGSTLIASGVPLLQVMDITAKSVDNVHIARSIQQASEKVKSGKSLSESLTGDPNFLELVPGMLGIGEQSGSTEQMMEKTAEYYEKEVDDAIKNISTIIEPAMMILMGVMALVIVAAVLLPIYTMSTDSLV